MAHGICELFWLQILLVELRLYKHGLLMLYRDNEAAIDITNNPIQHDRPNILRWITISSKRSHKEYLRRIEMR
jgi:hypothetical protein